MGEDSIRKDELRRNFLDKRKSLSEGKAELKSKIIVEELTQLNRFKEAAVIHSYVSIKKNREVDTIKFIKRCLETGKKVVVPKMVGEGKLKHIPINSLDDLEENNLGIPEPDEDNSNPISVKELDLVVVPMVAGDRFKNRIGYGAGYYDRFLENCSALKVGLLFDCQFFDGKLPVQEFDIPLDILISESRIIE
ncbi:5-formyltetrahydrofolate cyclo-ligase [Rhodohalobacter sulfatireducens]|uniref:5-formyltetrahydrofolate cyclo-ligase n=1 Tax=Rhodohalobacter sulfatireducens TaxID=2911366 RepID=A0ABS9KG21_9BACT|nr:5-formyltetrahydrofolate cyclo-ligase [Rhodohalobacter sulfatireducens]MCG2589776.1 5-formyltetrahydrofolate cyclo-ligase [Rhodohalobacter sulfatireducens]